MTDEKAVEIELLLSNYFEEEDPAWIRTFLNCICYDARKRVSRRTGVPLEKLNEWYYYTPGVHAP